MGVGSSVKDFTKGDRVVTLTGTKSDGPGSDDAIPTIADVPFCLGQGLDGTLRSFGVFPERYLVHAPQSLDLLHASTLGCTYLTGWNALFGLQGREVKPGSWVLVQGTGGASIATLQLAVAVGATVVATTSTDERAARLKELGAAHVVNYRTNPDSWGQEARKLTPHGRGFDIVADVGGNATLPHSLSAVRPEGIVLVIGGVGDEADTVPMFSALLHSCIVRGILAGTRNQLKQLVRFIDEKNLKLAADDVVFELADAKDAYRRLKEKKHFAKILIKIEHPE